MAAEKIKGLVIKTKNINENDKYLTVLCEKYGKIYFKAAGVRSFKSKNLAAAQPFTYSEFTILRTQNFTRMNEAQVIENFYDLRLDVASLALAAYISDIAGIICVGESEDDSGVLRLLLNSLYMLANKKLTRGIIKSVFELRVLTKSGFMPNLEECEICSRKYGKKDKKDTEDRADRAENFDAVFLDVIGGNLVCADCIDRIDKSNPMKLIRISRDILHAMKFVTGAEDEKLFSFAIHNDIERDFANVCEKYLLAQLNMNIDSLKQYKNYEK